MSYDSVWPRLVLAGCLAVALLGVAPAGHAATGHSTLLTVAVHPSTVLVGGVLAVSGKAVPALPGVGVTVLRLQAGHWHTLGHALESATGSYSLSVRAPSKPGLVSLRVIRSATATARAGVSQTLGVHVVTAVFKVRTHATTPVALGTPITVFGTVSPAAAGVVELQRRLGGRWIALATSKLTRSTFTLKAAEPAGTYTLRVRSPMTRTRAAGLSPAFSVVVRPRTPPPPIPPATVPGAPAVTVSFGAGSATVTWTPPADGGAAITGYRVSRDGTDPGGFGVYTANVAANVFSWTFLQLKTGEPYTFTVVAANAVGAGPAGSVTAGGSGP